MTGRVLRVFLNSFIHQALLGTLASLYRNWGSFAELWESTPEESSTSSSAPAALITERVLSSPTL